MSEPWNWRPIETAPKDGTLVLAWPFYGRIACAKFSEKRWRAERCVAWTLTHWMPLPAPPKLQPNPKERSE